MNTWIWIAIGMCVVFLIMLYISGCHDVANRKSGAQENIYVLLQAAAILQPLRRTHPDVWAQAMSELVGYHIDPPSQIEVERAKIEKWEEDLTEEARREAESGNGFIR